MTKEELREKANDLPLAPGVYLMMDKTGRVIYVGKAKKLKNRVSQYFQDSAAHTPKTRAMVSKIDHFDVIVAASEFPSPRGDKLCLQNCPTGACGIGPGSDRITISHSTATGKWQLEIKIPLIFLREPLQTAMQVAAMETRFAQSADSH